MALPVYTEGTKIGGNLQHVHVGGGTNGVTLSISDCTTSVTDQTITLDSANAAIAVGMLVTSAHLHPETYVVTYDSAVPSIEVSRFPKTASTAGAVLVFSTQYGPGRDDGFGLLAGTGIELAASTNVGTGRPDFTITSTSGAGSVGIAGSPNNPASGQIGYWSSTSSMGGDEDLTYSLTAGLAVGQAGTNSGAVADLRAFSATSGNYLHWDSSAVTLGLIGQSAKLEFYSIGSGEYISTNNAGLLSINAGGNLDLNGATLTLDSTDTTNLTMTANNPSNKTMTIAASNSGDGNGNISMTADGTFDIDAAGAVTIDGGSITIGGDSDVAVDFDAAAFDVDASGALTIDSATSLAIGTANSGIAITIGHGTSEVTFQDNETVTGNLTVSGDQTVINSTAIVAEDKTIVLGIAGGMEDATYARAGAVVTVSSTSHGFSNGESVYVSNMGNSITDGVYAVSSVATNTFIIDSHGTSGTVGSGATMQHSSANTTEATADTAGIYVPGTTLHSLQYDTSNGWTFSNDLDITDGHLSFGGTTKLTSTTWYGTTAASLVTVGALDAGSITSNFTSIDTGSGTISTSGTLTGGAIVGTSLAVSGTITGDTSLTLDSTTLTTAELGVLDGITTAGGTVTASRAVVVDSNKDIASFRNLTGTGQLKGGTLSVDAIAVLDTSTGTASNLADSGTQELAQFAWATYRTVKYVGQVTDGTDVDAFEVLVTWGGHASDAENAAASIDMTTYAYVTSDTALGNISTTVDGTYINLIFTNISGDTISALTYDVVATHLAKQ